MLDTAALVQGSQEWLLARAGSLGASRVHDAIAKTKTGWGASRANIAAELTVERLTGQPSPSFTNDAMRWGTTTEPDARNAYSFEQSVDVAQVGIIRHPLIEWTHASPDGLIGDDGLVEIKCPNSATHIETLRGGKIPAKYETQGLWQLACTGRHWVDFVSYDPRLPVAMQLFVKRLDRDDKRIAELEKQVAEFLAEVDAAVSDLLGRYS